jgi:hypothetical protein
VRARFKLSVCKAGEPPAAGSVPAADVGEGIPSLRKAPARPPLRRQATAARRLAAAQAGGQVERECATSSAASRCAASQYWSPAAGGAPAVHRGRNFEAGQRMEAPVDPRRGCPQHLPSRRQWRMTARHRGSATLSSASRNQRASDAAALPSASLGRTLQGQVPLRGRAAALLGDARQGLPDRRASLRCQAGGRACVQRRSSSCKLQLREKSERLRDPKLTAYAVHAGAPVCRAPGCWSTSAATTG